MITILHLITGLEVGGAERMLAHIASCSDRHRFRSVVVSMTGPGRMGPLIEAEGITVRSLGLRRGAPDPRGILRLLRTLREFRPDILQTWLYHADLLGVIAKQLGPTTRLVWNVRCTEMEGTAGLTAGRTAEVRYESMVSDPDGTAEMLADFLELSSDGRAGLHASLARARPDSVGRWRAALDERQLAEVLAEIGPLLARLGYA